MASTTLTLPAALASPAAGTILALDLGTTAGFALRAADTAITSGTATFRPDRWQSGGMKFLRFKRWLTEIKNQAGGVDAAHAFGGWLAILTAWCDHHQIAYQGVPVGTIKRCRQAGRHRRCPRARFQPRRRQRSRRHRDPAVGDRDRWRRAMTRVRLPNRRPAEIILIEHAGQRFTVTVGLYPNGRPGEVFIHGMRTGSSLDALLADACVLLSLLMQHGIESRELASSMGRLGNTEPASIIGAVIDLIAATTAAKAGEAMEGTT